MNLGLFSQKKFHTDLNLQHFDVINWDWSKLSWPEQEVLSAIDHSGGKSSVQLIDYFKRIVKSTKEEIAEERSKVKNEWIETNIQDLQEKNTSKFKLKVEELKMNLFEGLFVYPVVRGSLVLNEYILARLPTILDNLVKKGKLRETILQNPVDLVISGTTSYADNVNGGFVYQNILSNACRNEAELKKECNALKEKMHNIEINCETSIHHVDIGIKGVINYEQVDKKFSNLDSLQNFYALAMSEDKQRLSL